MMRPPPAAIELALPRRTPTGLVGDPAVRHLVTVPAREPVYGQWPAWLDPQVQAALERSGIARPWEHQQVAADLAWSGADVGLVTGTASGKSLAYGMPGLSAALAPPTAGSSRGATVLYLSPTKALAQDQLGQLHRLALPALRASCYDGDTPKDERAWARSHARWLISNPDMLHRSLIPGHERWRSFLRQLRLVVIDEAHAYRGVFGAHVALVLRRLLRVCSLYGAQPTVMATSATTADPADRLEKLVGRPVAIVANDASPRPQVELLFWQPPVISQSDEPKRRGVVAESAAIMGQLIRGGHQTLVFTRSRRAAEALAGVARDAKIAPGRIAAYRGGYLPEERRVLEAGLRSGELQGLAATNALELGIDISGLDAIVMAGWPGSRASFWQMSGRAGRRGRPAVVVMVAREDPLDQYLIEHPEVVLDRPLEAGTFNVSNPYVLAPHLAAAAAEAPLTDQEVGQVFGASALRVCDDLAQLGLLRRRRSGWYWTSPEDPSRLTDLRGAGGSPVRIVEEGTGKLLGTVDRPSAPGHVHPGAVYTHQGLTYVITSLDLDDHVCMAVRMEVDYDTTPRQKTSVSLGKVLAQTDLDRANLSLREVEVTGTVTSFLKRRWPSGEVLGEFPLDLAPACLPTTAACLVIEPDLLVEAGIDAGELAGALHATEHAAIALLPLIATCDRWDIGGVSMTCHPQTGRATIIIYDGSPGGAGFAEAGYQQARNWLAATRRAIELCDCAAGCPSCVQSPKCGNGNNPLDKRGALCLLDRLLAEMASVGDQIGTSAVPVRICPEPTPPELLGAPVSLVLQRPSQRVPH